MAALTFRSQGWRLQRSCVVPVSDVESLRTAVSVSQDDPSDQQELIGKMTQPGTRAVPMPGAPSGRSEKVHRAFLVRLRNDRVRLTLLAAHALELAAGAAAVLQADNSDVDAWAALEVLRDLLGSASGGIAASR
jgi:hypothetical protein